MGHTNSTVNYNLPQFVGTDKPSWLGDVNGAFLAIDTAIAAAKTQADSAAGGVAGLQTVVGGHTTQIGTLTDTVTAQGGTLNSVTALIGNGTPTTTDQTIIGAINELNAELSASGTIDASSGKAFNVINYGLIGGVFDTDDFRFWVPFPFTTKDTNYNITMNNIGIDGVGNATEVTSVVSRTRSGVWLKSAISQTGFRMLSVVNITVTF